MKSSLKSLSLKGFRSFVDPSKVQFPQNGLVLISGKNLDAAGVSSGSGKSSLLLAISHALGFCPYSGTDLQAWNGDEDLGVELELETAEGTFLLKKGGKTSFSGPNANVTGAAASQEWLTKKIGIDTELLSALTYRPQKTPGLFLSKTNSEMQEFLSVLLGLHSFENAIAVTQDNIKKLEVDLARAQTSYNSAVAKDQAASLRQLPTLQDEEEFFSLFSQAEKMAREAERVAKMAQEDHSIFSQKMASKRAHFADIKASFIAAVGPKPVFEATTEEIEDLKRTLNAARARLKALVEGDDKRIREIRSEIGSLKAASSLLSREIADANMALGRAEGFQKEIDTLKGNKCPKCHQEWLKGESALLEAEHNLAKANEQYLRVPALLETQANSLKQIEELESQCAPNPKIEQMREVVEHVKSELDSKTNLLQADYNVALARWNQAISDATARITEQEKKELAADQAELEARWRLAYAVMQEANKAADTARVAENKYKLVRKDNQFATIRIQEIEQERAAAKAQLEVDLNLVEILQNDLKMESDLLEALKAFLTAIFDEVLDEIAYNTNQMLGLVPNVAHVTLKFRSESTTQKGTIKRAIAPVVTIGGAERPLKSALSGGMATAVELAVDLAVRKVISARSGVNPSWLILDECFEGLGSTEKEACLDLLKQAAQDTLILVVDHGSETKELFSERIEVEHSNGRSRVV